MKSLVVRLDGRGGKHVVAIACDTSLRLFEGDTTKTAPHATFRASAAALETLVARRVKLGFRETMRRADNPWLEWVDGLEEMFHLVVADAKSSGCTIGKYTAFRRAAPHRADDRIRTQVGSRFADLPEASGRIRMQWVLAGRGRQYDIAFEIGLREDWVVAEDDILLWKRLDHGGGAGWGSVSGHGVVSRNKTIQYDADDETARSADQFRAWFPRYVRDHVMGFTIAELADR